MAEQRVALNLWPSAEASGHRHRRTPQPAGKGPEPPALNLLKLHSPGVSDF